MVTFGEAIKLYFINYVNFKERASRSEFWWATLFVFILGFVVSIIDAALSGGVNGGSSVGLTSASLNPLTGLFNLVTFLPSLAITVRRLHDIGKKGWWILLAYVPGIAALVTAIVLVVLAVSNLSSRYSSGANASLLGVVGFLILAGIVSIVAGIILLVWLCKPSVGPNQWGYPRDSGYSQYSQTQGYGYQPQQYRLPQQTWPQPGVPQQPFAQHPGYITPPVSTPNPSADNLQSPFKYGPPQTPGVPPVPPQNIYGPPQFGNNPYQPKDDSSEK